MLLFFGVCSRVNRELPTNDRMISYNKTVNDHELGVMGQMGLLGHWGSAFSRIAKTLFQLPEKKDRKRKTKSNPTAVRAREILATIRQGEYHFSSQELSEMIRRSHWLGKWREKFLSLELMTEQQVKLNFQFLWLSEISILITIVDLWHDSKVSSIDFKIVSTTTHNKVSLLWRIGEYLALSLVFMVLRWQGTWRYQSLSFVSPVDRILRVYVEWPQNRSLLLENVNVIGVQTYIGGLLLNTFRRPAVAGTNHFITVKQHEQGKRRSFWNRLEILFSWLLLGAYAFVLIHVTLPVLDGAFRLMPQDTKALHVWILKQTYNLLVILLSYFFLRITMLPLYSKWNKSREELLTLISLEARDHEYLQPLSEMVRKMQGKGLNSVPTDTIAQMVDLMSSIRERSRQRLMGMSQMRRSWIQDLIVGYLFIFSLEWMYYYGYLTPLSVSIDWVNRVMTRLFLYE